MMDKKINEKINILNISKDIRRIIIGEYAIERDNNHNYIIYNKDYYNRYKGSKIIVIDKLNTINILLIKSKKYKILYNTAYLETDIYNNVKIVIDTDMIYQICRNIPDYIRDHILDILSEYKDKLLAAIRLPKVYNKCFIKGKNKPYIVNEYSKIIIKYDGKRYFIYKGRYSNRSHIRLISWIVQIWIKYDDKTMIKEKYGVKIDYSRSQLPTAYRGGCLLA